METTSIQEGAVFISLPHVECIAQVESDQPWQVQMANGDVLLYWDVTNLWDRVEELLAVPPVDL
jgi:hypothetical protein